MQAQERLCLQCHNPIPADLRRDAKFCKEGHRIEYNNDRRFGLEPEIMRVDKILHKNFEVLKNLLKSKNKSFEVSATKLAKLGFKTDFCSYVKGSYCYCYYYSYKQLNTTTYLIGF